MHEIILKGVKSMNAAKNVHTRWVWSWWLDGWTGGLYGLYAWWSSPVGDARNELARCERKTKIMQLENGRQTDVDAYAEPHTILAPWLLLSSSANSGAAFCFCCAIGGVSGYQFHPPTILTWLPPLWLGARASRQMFWKKKYFEVQNIFLRIRNSRRKSWI